MQLFINMWCYLQWLFTYMYIHNLITYSCTKSIKMLWGLFLPMTNLLISFHQKSSVLLHEGSTFIHSLLWCSANFCNTSQNMHSYAPVASKHWTRNPYLVSFQGCWTQWQRFQSSTIHHFWDTPQHFLKTYFCWESGFLSFLELQKSLSVSFQGCWTQWQRFESISIYNFWDTPQHFLKTHFCWESGFHSFLELQKSPPVSFQGCWTQWQRFQSSTIHCFWDTP